MWHWNLESHTAATDWLGFGSSLCCMQKKHNSEQSILSCHIPMRRCLSDWTLKLADHSPAVQMLPRWHLRPAVVVGAAVAATVIAARCLHIADWSTQCRSLSYSYSDTMYSEPDTGRWSSPSCPGRCNPKAADLTDCRQGRRSCCTCTAPSYQDVTAGVSLGWVSR